MAQLRDVKTGEAVFAGSPLECILVAGELGEAAVSDQSAGAPDTALMYDDVGLGFNPDEVLESAHRGAEGTAAAAAAAKGEEKATLKARAAELERGLKADAKDVEQARRALEAARANLTA